VKRWRCCYHHTATGRLQLQYQSLYGICTPSSTPPLPYEVDNASLNFDYAAPERSREHVPSSRIGLGLYRMFSLSVRVDDELCLGERLRV